MFRCLQLSPAVLCTLLATTAVAAPPPIEAFARLPHIRAVSISPDGKRLAYITSRDDREIAATLARDSSGGPKPIISSQPGEFDLEWCGWANEKRLLCGVSAAVKEGRVTYPVTRLVAMDADGANQKVLVNNARNGSAQFQDDILDWTPEEPDTVLIAVDGDHTGFPAIFELDVNTGRMRTRSGERPPIRRYSTDGKGNPRLGFGYIVGRAEMQYFARLDGDKEWRRLFKLKAFEETDALVPIAAIPGTNRAYATGSYEGRDALWEVDLSDQVEPKLVFSHPLVDAAEPLLTPDRRLIGIYYETDRPFVYYTDEETRDIIAILKGPLPSTFNTIVDYSDDRKTYVIRASSDVEAATYYTYDVEANRLTRFGTAYPELDPKTLGRMRSITYPARDGVEIPGYLTVPFGVRAEKLPLIVMPHGGPISRDSWDFDFLRAFLVSRGYAVLQMNFRGSSGYGSKWLADAHQDWGGLTYADITDGAQWAVREGIADPKRMCIVGWSFGGYAALLGAVRNPDLYRCAASIAGVSDLNELLWDSRYFSNKAFVKEQIGTNRDKLKEDSPLRHARSIGIPVFLIHGDRDIPVDIDHSRKMAAALKSADKPHRAIFLKDTGHSLERKSDRVTLLTELEKFLSDNLGPGVQSAAAGLPRDSLRVALPFGREPSGH